MSRFKRPRVKPREAFREKMALAALAAAMEEYKHLDAVGYILFEDRLLFRQSKLSDVFDLLRKEKERRGLP